ncbi:HYR domain-containing protein [Psychroserpens sp. BH13MA-6]
MHLLPSLTPTVSDNCGSIVSQTYTLTGATVGASPINGINDASSENFLSGTTTVTYTVTDASNNSQSCSFTVTINDSSAPTVICPPDVTYTNDPGFCYAVVNNFPGNPKQLGVPSVFDNCVGLNTQPTGIPPGTQFPVGTTTITWVIIDAAGNTVNCTQNVTITDDEPPSITCPSNITVNTDAGECFATVTIPDAIATDNCSIVSTSNDFNAGGLDASGIYPLGTTTVTFSATASDGLTTTCSMDVTVVNNQIPVITLNGSATQTIEACDTYTEEGAIAIDNCLGDISADIIIDDSDLDVTTPGTYTITYNVTNVAGASAIEVIRTITVVDTTAPTLSLIGPNPITIGDCSTYTELGAIADDGCVGDISSNVVIDNSTVNTSNLGSYTVTYNVTDASGNVANQITRTVVVADVTAPDIVLIGDNPQVIEACSPYIELGATAIDPCFGIDYASDLVVDISGLDTATPGTYLITYNVVDNANNPAVEVIRTIEVVDTTLPTIVCPSDLTVSNDLNECQAVVNYTTPIGTDSCSTVMTTQTAGLSSGSMFPLGTTTNTFEVVDAYGNSTTCSFNITVEDTEAPTITCPSDIIQNTDAGYCGAIVNFAVPTATDNCSATVSINQLNGLSSGSFFPIGTTTNTFEFTDDAGNTATCSFDVTINNTNSVANAGMDYVNTVCTNTSYVLNANSPGGLTTGLWSVSSGQTSGFSFSDPTDANATFTGDIGETYILTWSLDYPGSCPDSSDDVAITFIGCDALDFDGVDDNITFRDNFNVTGDFTIEIWVKSEQSSANVQTILSKRETNNQVDGYDLRIVNNVVSFNWNNGLSLSTAPYQIQNNTWHHIAISHSGSLYTLYVDGVNIASMNGVAPISNSVDFILGAMEETIVTPVAADLYFDGGLDEFRIWNTALDPNQIRFMMNQEITNENPITNVIDGNIYGVSIPLPINGLVWSNLDAYYKMNQNTDISSGVLLSNNANTIDGTLRFMTTFQPETAPIPYQTQATGLWDDSNTWLHGTSQLIPGSTAIDGSTPIDWNIVSTSHDVSSGDRDITVLGLIVDSNILTIENSNTTDGQGLRITDYLKLNNPNATLHLMGESQLLQDMGSVIDYSGNGRLIRDQQGTSNLYNYNYWSAPVSNDGNTYTIGNMLFDGNMNVQWTSNHDADPTTNPITLSNRWLYTYENFPENSYADWQAVDENSSIDVGLGFIMKGSGSSSALQNYSFIGQPNNGTITIPITSGNQALVGNPYPSALDAHTFINDNVSATQGTLYFWEHFNTNTSHVLSEYEGGYAAYNLSGGVGAVSPPEISSNGTPSKIPERYIPVAQGFYVVSNTTGGSVLFENDQRVFVKEMVTGPSDSGSVFMRTTEASEDTTPNETSIKRLRVSFTSPENAKRQLLLAFVPNGLADDGVNYGYDGINTESLSSDMSWDIDGASYIIQGVGPFSDDSVYPLHISVGTSGINQIGLDELENFDSEIDVYVFDALLGSYHQINDISYQIYLESGQYHNRFFIVFANSETLSVDSNIKDAIDISYVNNLNEIHIAKSPTISITKCTLYNVLGQVVRTWTDINSPNSDNILKLPISNLAVGGYIISVETNLGMTSKQILIGN